VEALLARCQVICYLDQTLKKYLFPNCPIVSANINQLETKLLKCIQLQKMKQINFQSQIEWVKTYHSLEKNHQPLFEVIQK